VLLNTSGQISLLRVHDLETGFGPPSDAIDVEVVVQFAGRPGEAFGFQLRSDDQNPARRGMLDLLRDAFNHGWVAHIDFEIGQGHHNGVIKRTWLTKPPQAGPVVHSVIQRPRGPKIRASSTSSVRARIS
jgi:hypothetical protein